MFDKFSSGLLNQMHCIANVLRQTKEFFICFSSCGTSPPVFSVSCCFERYEPKRDFGSIWAVGLPVCPPVRLPSLLVPARIVSHAPAAAARAVCFGPQLDACQLCLPRATVRPSKPRPWSHIAHIATVLF